MNLKIPKVKQSSPLPELTAFLNLRKSGFNFINQRNGNVQLMVAGQYSCEV